MSEVSPTHLCGSCMKWHEGEVCPQFILTQEQRDAMHEAEVAMRDTSPRESVRQKVDRAWGIDLVTIKDKCSVCEKDGIWIEEAPTPLVCGSCQQE